VYVSEGVVVAHATGAVTECRGSTTFIPDAPNGTVRVEIAVERAVGSDTEMAGAVAAGRYVVFETVTLANSGDVVAVHADLDDAAQTFVVPPRVVEAPPTPADPPASTVPTLPAIAAPPTIPKVGSDAARLAAVIGLGLFTAGVALMELRHGRIRRTRGASQVRQ
jgi:hypothetical protein